MDRNICDSVKGTNAEAATRDQLGIQKRTGKEGTLMDLIRQAPIKKMKLTNEGELRSENVTEEDGRTKECRATISASTNNLTSIVMSQIMQRDSTACSSQQSDSSLRVVPPPECLFKRNVSRFIDYFSRSHNARFQANMESFPATVLPGLAEFKQWYNARIASPKCSVTHRMRFASVSEDSIRRAAASALYFLSYEQLQSGKVHLSVAKAMDAIDGMTTEVKANKIVEFLSWYENVPLFRQSPVKVVLANGELARAQTKEESTLGTVCRGLLAFFTFVGVLYPSSPQGKTDECRIIWNSVNSFLKVTRRRKGGPVEGKGWAICQGDLIYLMQKADGVRSLYGLQGWFLALFLAGTGLRVGSLRRSRKAEMFCASESDSEEEGPAHQEYLEVDFDFLANRNVKIFRVDKGPADPAGTFRFRVEVEIVSTKTVGTRLYLPQVIGYSYPRTNENGSTDWSPTVAVAILLQMVLNGSVSPLDLAGPESEPEVGQEKIIDVIRREDPVFTAATLHQKLTQRPMRNVTNVLEVVADTLKLPSAAFTSRAYRRGFAKSVVEGFIKRQDEQRMVSAAEIRDALYTTSMWRSSQANRYIRSISDALISRSLCDVGGTSISWRCAIFENSPWARIDKYRHETELPNENVPKKNRKELIRAINLNNWVSAPVKAFNPEEPDPSAKETKFNLIKAIRQVIVMKRSESPTEVLGGQMVCPVVDCPIEAKDYIGKFDEHWFQVHEERKNELKYRCAQCINGQTCSFKSYSAHRSKRHPVESPVFRWVYDE